MPRRFRPPFLTLPAVAALWTISGLLLASSAVQAQQVTDTPVTAPLSQRFVLIVLDQPDRDLSQSSAKINMMYDTKTGRSWVLQYTVKPNSNEQGYVWSEVPYATPPK
jgi:hypothetical protein